jgi:hypothetical protein
MVLMLLLPFGVTGQTLQTGLKSSIGLYYSKRLPRTLSVLIQKEKHQWYMGLDLEKIWRRKSLIMGMQSGYQYHFLRQHRLSHFYADANFGFIRFGSGLNEDVPYKYKPVWEYEYLYKDIHANLIASLGYQLNFSRSVSIYLECGTALYYRVLEPVVSRLIAERGFFVLPAIRIGLRIDLFKIEKKRVSPNE